MSTDQPSPSISPRSSEELFPLLYEELKSIASRHLAKERPGQTLQPTALVHEAFFRLGQDEMWNSRGHFFAAAAEAMRRILVDNARKKQRIKHGGKHQRMPLEMVDLLEDDSVEQVLAVDEALGKLAETGPQAADLVKLRYFAGLTLEESANCLEIPRRTADRLWAFAKAWLHRELRQ